MKALFAIALLIPLAAAAQSRPLETTDEARQRHNAERYGTYRDRGGNPPLGGYSERLGDPAPRDTESPGFTPPPRQRDRDGFSTPSSSDRLRGSDGFLEPVVRPRR